MTTTLSSQTWTAVMIDTALVHINTALATLRCRPHSPIDTSIERAVDEARQLELYLEQHPQAGTADALACCRKLLEVRAA
jgi:hypothetical protein